jgi:NADH dehydrogenase
MPTPARIVILGGGFGGVYTALELENALARRGDIEVTLVNRDNFFLFTPMLHEVAASDLDVTHIVNPIRKLVKRVRFFAGDAESIDLDNRIVHAWHGEEQHRHELPYDHLVLALGSVTNFYGLPGLDGRAMTMKSLGDAIALRNRVIGNLEEADFECCAALREPLLTFVVAGGGFAGVETAAAINDFAHEALRFYPNLAPNDLRVVLVHSGKVILPELSERLGHYARRKLEGRGVDVRLGVKVAELTREHVRLSDGSMIRSFTLVWTAGTSPSPILATLPCMLDRGRIVVDEALRVPDRPGVWALGDCAVIPNPRTGRPHPPTAQHAIREGRTVARNIVATVRGGRTRPFRFSTIGQLASLGRRTGVASILGINFSGFIAWWLWRTIYLSKLPRLEKKVRVALDWTLDLFFSKDLVQFQTTRSAPVPDGPAPDSAVPNSGVQRHAAAAAAAATALPPREAVSAIQPAPIHEFRPPVRPVAVTSSASPAS